MLTRATIAAALPPDVLRMADWYVELRVQMHAALATMPTVREHTDRPAVVPYDLLRAMQCDEACSWLARRMELWPPPIDWPRSWWLVYAGVEASGAVQDVADVMARKGGKR